MILFSHPAWTVLSRSQMWIRALLLFAAVTTTYATGTVSLDPVFHHRVVSVQESHNNLFTITFNLQPVDLTDNDLRLVDADLFTVDSSTLNVSAVEPLQVGHYGFSFLVFVGAPLIGYAVVEVTALPGEGCELQAFGRCGQFCNEDTSALYGYSCSCAAGYVLQIDGYTCLAAGPLPLLLVAHDGNITVFNPITRAESEITLSHNVDVFDCNIAEQVVYYVDNALHTVFATTIGMVTTSENISLLDPNVVASALAVNWNNNDLYYIDSMSSTIKQINTETETVSTILSSLVQPRSLQIYSTLNSNSLRLLWIEGHYSNSSIISSSLSGSAKTYLASGLNSPVDAAVDSITEKVYWVLQNGSLQVASISGGEGVETVYNFESTSVPSGVTVFETFAYVSLNGSRIRRINLLNPGDPANYTLHTPSSTMDILPGIKVFHPLTQSSDVPSVSDCSQCQHSCVVSSESITCDCRTGFRLLQDGYSCIPDQATQLIISSSVEFFGLRGIVFSTNLDGLQNERIVDSSLGSTSSTITGLIYGMEFDLENEMVFFGDRNESSIWQVSFNRITSAQDDRTLLVSNVTAWALSYDWISGVLYWTDDVKNVIGSTHVSGSQSGVIQHLRTNLQEPRGIAVDPYFRWVYWLEGGSNPKLSRCSFNGSLPQVLINSQLSGPTGLVIDFFRGALFWGSSGKIERSTLDGTQRTEVYSDSQITPFNVGIVGSYVVFTSVNGTDYSLVDVDDGTGDLIQLTVNSTISTGRPLYGLAVADQISRISSGLYSCVQNTLGCSHNCAVDENDTPFCDCPDGYTLLPDVKNCEYNELCFVCQNGGTCTIQGVSTSISCECASGYSGEYCQTFETMVTCDDSPCQNGGECNAVGTDSYQCDCADDFTGINCETALNGCFDNPCDNGVCVSNSNDGGFSCDCVSSGYTGDLCETDIDECMDGTICQNGGTCSNFDGGFSCDCGSSGYTGDLCETDIDECMNSTICQNGGTCNNLDGGFSCDCGSSGYTGDLCETDIDECMNSTICQNGGTCNNFDGGFSCDCGSSGYTGDLCETDIDECMNSTICQNGGTCNNFDGGFSCDCGSSGYTGDLCETDIDECMNSTICQNGGTCSNFEGSFSCDCGSSGYTGDLCETDIDECMEDDLCQNGGTCSNTAGSFVCVCAPGYTGDLCDEDINECIDDADCQNGGTCNNFDGSFFCDCGSSGYTGDLCETDIDECMNSTICQNGGTCSNFEGGFSCDCGSSGYTGDLCETDIDECMDGTICQNGGTCSNFDGGFSCDCGSSGYTGDLCETDIDECMNSTICQNGGTCSNFEGGFSCDCGSSGYTGDLCETDIDECMDGTICQNGGTCNNLDGSFSCDCGSSGYTGDLCETDIDECMNSTICQNGGTCSNFEGGFSCDCGSSGYTGDLCETDIDECMDGTICQNGGTCSNFDGGFSCDCGSSGYTGDLCETDIDECMNSTICQNGGTCSNFDGGFSCDCGSSGYTGDLCETDIDECMDGTICQNGGTCSNFDGGFSCDCGSSGYTGDLCETDIDECMNSTICQNGGTCSNFDGGFSCDCGSSGYTGDLCETDIDECMDGTICQNGGTCNNLDGGFSCDCGSSGYTGDLCETDIDECMDGTICQNGGTCSNFDGGFSCDCGTSGYTGDLCETDIDECTDMSGTICLNNGDCVNLNGSFRCDCAAGFEGTSCENICSEGMFGVGCVNSCTCFNNATCDPVDGSCNCTEEYQGPHCLEPVCNDPCINNGTCASPDFCMCIEPFGGPTCDQVVCTDGFCLNGGTCVVDFGTELSCRCPTNTRGPNCQFQDIVIIPGQSNTSIGTAVGVPISVVITVLIVLLVVGFGVFYYVKCVHFRKRKLGQDEIAPHHSTSRMDLIPGEELQEVQLEMDNPTYDSVVKLPVKSNVGSEVGHSNGIDQVHHTSDSPYHAYEETEPREL